MDRVSARVQTCNLRGNRVKRSGMFVGGVALLALVSAGALAGPFEDGQAAMNSGNYAQARSAFGEAAAKGNAHAQTYLGIIYAFGLGVPVDNRQALEWLTLAAEAGDPAGESQLGDMYLQGRGVTADAAQALKYLTAAAKQNFAPAQYRLAAMYELGQGTAKDERQAVLLYGQAAKQGYPDALFRLGYFYFYGIVLPKNFESAVPLLRAAAAAKSAPAMALLGFAYDNGYGVPQDYAQAARLYARAAAKGNPNALALLGEKYANGKGVAQDWAHAYMFLSLAAARSEGKVQETLAHERDQAATHLDGAALTQAQNEAGQCAESKFAQCALTAADGDAGHPGGLELEGSGSGFYVSKAGEIITNNHVVQDCGEMRLNGKPVKVLAADKDIDLAILATGKPRTEFARLRGARGDVLGESVVAVGFPLNDILSKSPIVTNGVVSALKGMEEDGHDLQFSAPVQPGNSGGPILGADGAVVGVVRAVLGTMEMANLIGVMPQNVNFGVNLATLKTYLKAHKIAYVTESGNPVKDTATIAAEAARYTVLLECWK